MFCDIVNHRTKADLTISIAVQLFGRGSHLGVAFNRATLTHVGHLAGDLDIKLDIPSGTESHPWWCSEVEYYHENDPLRMKRRAHTALIDLICRSNQSSIPYCTVYNGAYFSPEAKIQYINHESGLTCATFVLAIFKTLQIDLVDFQTWEPRQSDDIWRDAIGPHLPLRNINAESGNRRFRPEEVFVSSINPHCMVEFRKCEMAGIELMKFYLTPNDAYEDIRRIIL